MAGGSARQRRPLLREIADQVLERTPDLADRLQRHPGVAGGGLQLLVPERPRVIMRTFYVIESKSPAEPDWLLGHLTQ